VGILEDVTKSVPNRFQHDDDLIFLWHPYSTNWDEQLDRYVYEASLGSSEYAKIMFGEIWGRPPDLWLQYDRQVNDALSSLANARLLKSASDIGSGGLAVAMAKLCIFSGLGARIESMNGPTSEVIALFHEFPQSVLLTCDRESLDRLKQVIHDSKLGGLTYLGRVTALPMLEIRGKSTLAISASLDELRAAWSGAIEAQLAAEVVTG
jgi:phosphoribosylformylglycinamidine synthase